MADWVAGRVLARRTGKTLTTSSELHDEIERIRKRGHSVDDQENEPGVNCLAVPTFLTSPSTPSGVVSISALAYRTPLGALIDDVDAIRQIVGNPQ